MVQSAVIDVGLQARHRLEQGRADLGDVQSLLRGLVWHGVLLTTPCEEGVWQASAAFLWFIDDTSASGRRKCVRTWVGEAKPGTAVPSAPRRCCASSAPRPNCVRRLDYFTTKYCRLMQVCHVRTTRWPYASSSKA